MNPKSCCAVQPIESGLTPETKTGGWGRCRGRGDSETPSTWKNLPWWEYTGSIHRPWTISYSRAARPAVLGGDPKGFDVRRASGPQAEVQAAVIQHVERCRLLGHM